MTAVVLAAMPVAGRAYTLTDSGLVFDIGDDGLATVIPGEGFYRGSVVVPADVQGHRVAAVGRGAFNGCHGLRSVSLPESLTTIGDYAFSGCDSLDAIIIPAAVTLIGDHAFARCTRLTVVAVPDAVQEIGDYAFYGCNKVTEITVGKGLRAVGYRSFQGCKMLESIIVDEANPNFVTDRGDLYDASMTTLLAAPRRHASRRDFVIPAGVLHVAPYAYHNASLTRTLTLPDGLLTVGERAFAGNTLLKTLTLPASLWSMGTEALDGCTALVDVHCLSVQPMVLSEYASPFGYLTDLSRRTLYVPAGSLNAYQDAPVWRLFGTIVEEGFVAGDVNGDGEVSIADVTALVSIVVAGTAPEDAAHRADVNADGEVGVADITALVALLMNP